MRHQPLSTFSIAARCQRTGQLGIAVATADVAAGRLVAWARAGVGAVAVQSWPNLYAAIEVLDLLARGERAEPALEATLAADPAREVRQVGVVDAGGGAAAWSGEGCSDWYGHVTGEGFSTQGTMLAGEEPISEMARAFVSDRERDLDGRLLSALEAGQAAGGDRRGAHSSALYVVHREEFPLWDLRVDEHPDPVRELRRIHALAREQLLPFVEGLPTRGKR